MTTSPRQRYNQLKDQWHLVGSPEAAELIDLCKLLGKPLERERVYLNSEKPLATSQRVEFGG